jgi:hypothetical protein
MLSQRDANWVHCKRLSAEDQVKTLRRQSKNDGQNDQEKNILPGKRLNCQLPQDDWWKESSQNPGRQNTRIGQKK